jgi:sialate O-acetylesterase
MTIKENDVLKLASLFGDHAVLQQGKTIPVWGTATPLGRIECRLGRLIAATVVSDDGRFMVRFPAQPAGGPFELSVRDTATDESLTLHDLYIGEVWLASGQSNMELPLAGTGAGGREAMRHADLPRVRFYTVPVTTYPAGRSEANGSWQVCSPATAGNVSAIAFHFARHRQPDAGTAVGVIVAAYGGTNIEAWLSRAALMAEPEYAAESAGYDSACCAPELYAAFPKNEELFNRGLREQKFWEQLLPVMPENTGVRHGWEKPAFDDAAWERMVLPDSWTLAGYNHAGVFWYRLAVELPTAWAGNELELGLGAADKADITYFNGETVGATGDARDMQYWMTPRRYAVPGRLVKAGRNVIAVRVASAVSICADGGLIGPAAAMTLALKGRPDTAIPLAVEWRFKMEHNLGIDGAEKLRLLGPGEAHSLHMMFDNMIAPLAPYAVRGAIWYQGEANAICGAARYRRLLGALMADWKRQWGQSGFEFLIVQLPGFQAPRLYSEKSTWALLREAQAQAAADQRQPPPVVTIDCGDADNLHPPNKEPVGQRLALAAAGKSSGPQFRDMNVSNGRLQLVFDTSGACLTVRGEKLDGFVVAGRDGVFHPAQATIKDATTVEVQCREVAEPCAVRYAWSNNPAMANLTDDTGLPAAPFRQE